MGDEDLRRGDELGAAGVMLTDPRLVIAELVEQPDRGDVARQCRRRVLAGRCMERRHEDAEAESRHGSPPVLWVPTGQASTDACPGQSTAVVTCWPATRRRSRRGRGPTRTGSP